MRAAALERHAEPVDGARAGEAPIVARGTIARSVLARHEERAPRVEHAARSGPRPTGATGASSVSALVGHVRELEDPRLRVVERDREVARVEELAHGPVDRGRRSRRGPRPSPSPPRSGRARPGAARRLLRDVARRGGGADRPRRCASRSGEIGERRPRCERPSLRRRFVS